MRKHFLTAAILWCIFSCNHPSVSPAHQSVPSFTCKPGIIYPSLTAGNSSFAVYIPEKKKEKYPVLIFFDAQGRGTLPLDSFKNSAEKYGYIFIGSNDSRNGNDQNVAIMLINDIIRHVKTEFPVDTSRIYTAGFSGGARIALLASAMHPEVKGAIAIAAGMPGPMIKPVKGRIITVAGKQDFNFSELTSLDADLEKENKSHFMFVHNGKHDWCSAEIMDDAMLLFEGDAVRAGTEVKNLRLFREKNESVSGKVNESEKENKKYDAAIGLTYLIECNKDIIDVGEYRKELAKIKSGTEYSRQQEELNKLSGEERQLTQYYLQSIGRDLSWWQNEINLTNKNAEGKTERSYMLKRVLASLSVQCYMFARQVLSEGDLDKANYIISLYKITDPENKDAWYYSAVLSARTGNKPQLISDLEKAVKCGFKDKAMLLNETSFDSYRNLAEFNSITEKIN